VRYNICGRVIRQSSDSTLNGMNSDIANERRPKIDNPEFVHDNLFIRIGTKKDDIIG
jgi:hypothetical protein